MRPSERRCAHLFPETVAWVVAGPSHGRHGAAPLKPSANKRSSRNCDARARKCQKSAGAECSPQRLAKVASSLIWRRASKR